MVTQVRVDVPTQSPCLLTFFHFTATEKSDYGFTKNGLTACKLGKLLPLQSFIKYVGEDRYKPLVNFTLRYIADLDVPIKR